MTVTTESEATTLIEAPLCKTVTCKKPLTYLEKSRCWRCLICNPIKEQAPVAERKESFLDVKMTEKRVVELIVEHERLTREIVREELENWHIQKPPVMRDEIASANNAPTEIKEKTWRDIAKEMGISLHQPTGGVRKKVDVLADIEAKKEVPTDKKVYEEL